MGSVVLGVALLVVLVFFLAAFLKKHKNGKYNKHHENYPARPWWSWFHPFWRTSDSWVSYPSTYSRYDKPHRVGGGRPHSNGGHGGSSGGGSHGGSPHSSSSSHLNVFH